MKKRRVLYCATLAVLILWGSFIYWSSIGRRVVGTLSVGSPYGKFLYIEEYGLTLSGIDKDGVTYFCLPSYVKLTDIDMTDSVGKIYLDNGELLTEPLLGTVQNVKVNLNTEEAIPWKICFMKSENLHSVFISLTDSEISGIDHDIYSSVSVNVLSPSGKMLWHDDNSLIKGRGNATWDLSGSPPDKRPYEIKFSEKHPLGSISPQKKWALLAGTYEGTGILNRMVLDTAMKMGMRYTTESEWIDLYADGKYLGNYLVCSEPASSASSIIDEGGWLVEKNDVYFDKKPYGISTPHDKFTLKTKEAPSSGSIDDISRFINNVDSCMYSDTSSVNKYIDLNSFVCW